VKGLFSFLLLLLVLIVAIIVGSRNQELLTINYLIAQSQIRESTLMAICLGLGVIIGIVSMFSSWLRLTWQVTSLKSQVKKLAKED
jgi:putative membrane protein